MWVSELVIVTTIRFAWARSNLTGDLTENLTGDLTGDLTGPYLGEPVDEWFSLNDLEDRKNRCFRCTEGGQWWRHLAYRKMHYNNI